MKKILRTLCVLLGASVLLTGCLSDDRYTTVTTYGDMAITSMTLGTLNRYTETTSSSTGNDTIIKTTFSGNNYPMSIDHLNGRIYNVSEFPVGTDLEHVVFSLTTKNGGVVGIQSLTSDSIQWFASTDSIDFSVPRILRVYAIDGSGSRDYTVTLTASETTGVDFEWKKVDENDALAGWDDATRLVALRDTVYAVAANVVMKDTVAYALENGELRRSEDLENWETVADASQLATLFGSGTKELFAVGADGRVKHSEDEGLTWTDELLDDDVALFPTANLASTAWNYRPSDSTDYVLVAGFHPIYNDQMAVWRKISQYAGIGKGGTWVYMPIDDINPYMLPREEGLSMAYYDNKVLAVGAGKTMRESRDQGITWKTSTGYALPEDLTGSRIRMAANDNAGIWILTDSGQLWHGMKR